MKLIRGIHNLNKAPNKCVLTIGNFDGVHRGHQALLQRLKKEGKIRRLPVVVMIFEPHPLEFFSRKKAPARITRLREKLRYLIQLDVDYTICMRFDHNFSILTAQRFIYDLLIKRLGMQLLAVGDDFKFGAFRQGNFSLLKQAALKYDFNVISTKTFYEGNIRISSTAIREALAKDQLDTAEKLLGHPFIISGRVIHGNKIGRTIGFPTANLSLHCYLSPVKGVYIVEVAGINKILLPGIANIGTRPTVSGSHQQLEVHLLDMTIDIYGYYIDVILRKKIRNEHRFSSLNELKIQIARDRLIAREFFKVTKSSIVPEYKVTDKKYDK